MTGVLLVWLVAADMQGGVIILWGERGWRVSLADMVPVGDDNLFPAVRAALRQWGGG
jgi:hypothetical protein